MTTELVISLKNVSLSYLAGSNGGRISVLDDVSMDVGSGELVVVLGPSGCGKSSLLSLVLGLQKPDTGDVEVKHSSNLSSSTGMVFQDPVLFAWRTARQNVALPLEILQEKNDLALTTTQIDRAVQNALDKVGLAGFEDVLPQQLSGGMRARVAIARALVSDPSVIVMDEPFASLDDINRTALNLRLLEIKRAQSAAIIFVTHSIPEAILLADRVLMLSRRPGKVVLDLPIAFGNLPRDQALCETPEFIAYARQLRLALKEATDAS